MKENVANVSLQLDPEAPPTNVGLVDIPGHGQFNRVVMEYLP